MVEKLVHKVQEISPEILAVLPRQRRVTVFGKSTDLNMLALKWLIKTEFAKKGDKVYVGVPEFEQLLSAHDVANHYITREGCDGSSYALSLRLGRLCDTDVVFVLPDKGRMTMIEVNFAHELNLPVFIVYFKLQDTKDPNSKVFAIWDATSSEYAAIEHRAGLAPEVNL